MPARGLEPRAAAEAAWSARRGSAPELDAALAAAFCLAASGPADRVPRQLGEGWIAEEAAAIALWCVLIAPEPIETLRLAVNIDGDSDTTGALVGQVLGAWRGPDWIPPRLLEQLELREAMERLAADAEALFDRAIDFDGPVGTAFWEWYPGW